MFHYEDPLLLLCLNLIYEIASLFSLSFAYNVHTVVLLTLEYLIILAFLFNMAVTLLAQAVSKLSEQGLASSKETAFTAFNWFWTNLHCFRTT